MLMLMMMIIIMMKMIRNIMMVIVMEYVRRSVLKVLTKTTALLVWTNLEFKSFLAILVMCGAYHSSATLYNMNPIYLDYK